MNPDKIIAKIKELQDKAKACNNSLDALDIQKEVILVMKEALKNKEFVAALLRKNPKALQQ